ncbi:MAG: amidohydrolase family protein [Bacteroidota bacterium]
MTRYLHHVPILLTFVLALTKIASYGQVASAGEYLITSVRVISMEDEKISPEQHVLIRDGRIISIGTKKPAAAVVIDGKGNYLMPGLSEMHAHVPHVDDLAPMKDVMLLYACNGITTIRGMLGHPLHLELRSKVASGEIIGPRLYTSGPSFSGLSVKTPKAGAELVRKQKAMGYDFLKLHPGLSRDKFRAIVATAKEVGITYGGHVSFGVGLWEACSSGYATIDHLDGMTEAMVPGIDTLTDQTAGLFGMFVGARADQRRIPEVMRALKENRVSLVPTQTLAERWFAPDATPERMDAAPEMIYMDRKTRDAWMQVKRNLMANPRYRADDMNTYIMLRRRMLKEAQHSGVTILLGSDGPQVFNVPGFSVHHELRALVNSGLTPYEALKTGTVNVAAFYQASDRGKVKPGYVADLVLLGANPLENISNTTTIEGVFLNGRWMSKSVIDNTLKSLVK